MRRPESRLRGALPLGCLCVAIAAGLVAGCGEGTIDDPAAGAQGGITSPLDDPAAAAAAGPPYPVVLAHGFFGFETFAGLAWETYFHGVKAHLAANGEPQVYTPAVDPFNDSTYRGEQLAAHVERILRETGKRQVILIGHSQGGFDARYVAHTYPERVAAVVTLSTPHRGAPAADVALRLVSFPGAGEVVDGLVRLLGAPLYDEVGRETSVLAALRQLSSAGAADFNARYPDAPGVAYYSLAGRSSLSGGGRDCQTDTPAPFIARWASGRDLLDPLLWPFVPVMGFAPHDGLVRVRDARWGTFWGCIPADHLDEVGQLLSDSPGLGNPFRHKAFYLALVRHLRALGH